MSDEITLFGKKINKFHLFFAAQWIAFFMMIVGFIVYIVMWYFQNR